MLYHCLFRSPRKTRRKFWNCIPANERDRFSSTCVPIQRYAFALMLYRRIWPRCQSLVFDAIVNTANAVVQRLAPIQAKYNPRLSNLPSVEIHAPNDSIGISVPKGNGCNVDSGNPAAKLAHSDEPSAGGPRFIQAIARHLPKCYKQQEK